METWLQDLRYGARTLRKSPGFTLVAVITLALGIGANTAMFSIVNALLLRPLPYAEPDRLLRLFTSTPQFREAPVSYPNFLDWQRRSQAFETMAAFRNDSFNMTGEDAPERLHGLMASATLFSLLGAHPIVGRTFTADEDRKGGPPVVVLTSNFWRERFGGDRQIVGRSITLDEELYTIIGVVPNDDVVLRRASIIIPIGQWSEPLFRDRSMGIGMVALGRLKAGVSLQQARSELNNIAAGLAQEFPKENKDRGIRAVSLGENLTGNVRTPLLVALGAVGFVLLIACANVANLMLARAGARRREFAVRGALGASRSRLMRQLLTEGFMLAALGGALGLPIAAALNAVFAARIASQVPRTNQVHLDMAVLAFTAVVSLLASALFGLAPAWQGARADLNQALREGGRGSTGRRGFQRVLVIAEVTLALVLTTSAGLMVRTMSRLWSVNPGFDPQNVLFLSIAGSPAVHGSPEAVRNGFLQTTERLRSVPGITAASLVFGGVPMNGYSEMPYWVEGRPKPAEKSQMDVALFYGVDPEYFNVMRIPLLRGRFLSPRDTEKTPCAVAIDEELAHKEFSGQEPLGQHLNLEMFSLKCEVVGVAGHVKHWGLDTDAASKVRSQVYIAFRQFPDSMMDLASTGSDYVVRTSGDPYSHVQALHQAVGGINGKMVTYGEQSMPDIIAGSLSARRFTGLLLGAFAILALALAAIGIYGVISYTVSQSTQEIGIRMALGAGRQTVLLMVLRDALGMALAGIVIGAACAFAVTRVMKGLLFGVSASDPFTFGAVAALLAIIALLASYIPALRATRIDPIVALRHE